MSQLPDDREVYDAFIKETWGGPVAERRCDECTSDMAQQFPELQRVRGHYVDLLTRVEHQHWWLVTPNEHIVDPTRLQFPDGGNGIYLPLREQDEPCGRCLNCGEAIYMTDEDKVSFDLCSKNCEVEFRASLMGCY